MSSSTVPSARDPGRDPRVAAYCQASGRDVVRADEAALSTPAVRSLWDWWQAARGEAAGIPERHRFDIAAYPSLAPNLFLVERCDGGFRLRLAGEAFVEMFGRRKGHEWRAEAPEPLARTMAGYFDFVAESGWPLRSSGRLKCAWADWFSFESLVCPLGGEDRGRLLGVAVKLPEEGPATE
ncbi:MAG TPA: PAS domain-containing protein [Candidatus Binatia bacterium]|nr:PAS domain-containing protein [Candidatus Binatia bacterium]